MKPEEKYKKLLEQATGTQDFGERMLQAQLRANDKAMRQIAESLKDTHAQTVLRIAEQIGSTNWQKMTELVAPRVGNQVAQMLAQVANSESFTNARLNAIEAIASTLAFQERNRELEANIAASFAKLSGAQNVISLASALAKQIENLEQFQSKFAQTMAQTLKSQFDEFEKRNQASFEQLEQFTNKKLHAPETKLREGNWMKVLQVLSFLIALAGLALAIAAQLESKEQSKVNIALAVQMLTALQQMASKAEQQVNVYYVAERTVRLKEKPNNRAKTLATVGRDDEVRLLERSHKWILVEYDSESGLLYGWANKKYLKRIR